MMHQEKKSANNVVCFDLKLQRRSIRRVTYEGSGGVVDDYCWMHEAWLTHKKQTPSIIADTAERRMEDDEDKRREKGGGRERREEIDPYL